MISENYSYFDSSIYPFPLFGGEVKNTEGRTAKQLLYYSRKLIQMRLFLSSSIHLVVCTVHLILFRYCVLLGPTDFHVFSQYGHYIWMDT